MSDAAQFIDIFQTVFPVVATVPGEDTELARAEFFGTAFGVAPGVYMTAHHVASAAAAHGELALVGGPSSQPMMGGAKVDHWESWPERDVALVYCSFHTRTISIHG
jgi:hypothetical protein